MRGTGKRIRMWIRKGIQDDDDCDGEKYIGIE
jgi:hypothetical protein